MREVFVQGPALRSDGTRTPRHRPEPARSARDVAEAAACPAVVLLMEYIEHPRASSALLRQARKDLDEALDGGRSNDGE